MWIRFVNHFQEEIGIYCPPSFHPKEQNSQPFFSEKIIAFLPGAPHSFGRQGADKIGNSSDPTSQILYYQSWKHRNINTEEKQKTEGKTLLMEGIWKVKSICTRTVCPKVYYPWLLCPVALSLDIRQCRMNPHATLVPPCMVGASLQMTALKLNGQIRQVW